MHLIFRVIFICFFFSLNFLAQTSPPKPLNFQKDHWTPYNPPTEFPEGTEIYIIQAGDTLWDLAQKKLGNPYLWPQIWENNKYILDAHWIYPGDPLIFGKEVEETPISEEKEEVPESVESEITEKIEEEKVEKLEQPIEIARPVPLGNDADIYCFAKITKEDENFPYKIIETEEPEVRYTLTQAQIVYINAGSEEGVKAGDSFLIAKEEGLIKVNGEALGKLWLLTGKLTVICAQEHTSTARIDYACQSIYRGESLIPFEAIPIPAKVLPPFKEQCIADVNDVHGKIIYSKDEVVSISQGHNVIVNLGTKDGIEPGALLRVYRWLPDHSSRIVIGRIGVLMVNDRTSIGKIFESNKEIYLGDEVELE